MRLATRLSALTVALTMFAACSDDGGTPPPTPTLAVSATTSTASVAKPGTATYPIVITRGGGYTGSVTLSASGLPADVVASFSPATLANGITASTMTLTVGSGAPVATTPNITVTATGSGNLTATTQVSLAVTQGAQSITLVTTPATLTVTQGATATAGITLTRTNFSGANDAVTIAVTGLPTGVTATLNPVSPLTGTTNQSTITFTAAAAATPGTSNVTVTASGTGITAQTQTIALTVAASTTPGFTLTAASAATSLQAGQSTTTPINVTLARQGGFTGDVALAVTGAPAGVTATLNPTSLTGTTLTSGLTIATTAAAAPGTYNLTITGTSAGQTARTATVALTITAPPSITVGLTPATLSLAAGGTATSNIAITRNGGLTGDVALTATNLPAGVTVTFAPATITGATTTSVATVNAAANAVPGTYTVNVNGAAGATTGTAPLSITVTAAQGITVGASNVSIAAGATGTSNITLTRAGGFQGAVNLALSGLPNGVTGVFNPTAPTGTATTSVLTLTVPANVAAGTYTGTITASGTGITTQTGTFTLTVTGGTGGNTVAYRFCDPTTLPLWVAVRQGTSGAWTQVSAGANNTYNLTFTGAVGGLAVARPDGTGGFEVEVYYFTPAELSTFATNECFQNPPTKTVTATVTGLSAGQSADVFIGSGQGTTAVNGNVTINGASEGTVDLIAVRYTTNATTFATTPDRIVIRRNINPAANSTITPAIDFNGAESSPIGTATYTIANLGSAVLGFGANSFTSANGAGASFSYGSFLDNSATRTVYGVPGNRTQAGDLQTFFFTAADDANGNSFRIVGQSNRDIVNRTITLGAALTAPTITTLATAPYLRLRAAGPWQAEYGEAMAITFTQEGTPQRVWTLSASRGYFGAAAGTYELDMPDFSGVAGWNNTWGLRTGVATDWSISAFSGLAGLVGGGSEGASFRGAGRTGTINP